MPIGLYADVHVPGPAIQQLRDRGGVDVLAATEEGTNEVRDHELLALANSLQRVMVTQDIRFRVLAEEWQRTGRLFAGLVFAHQRITNFIAHFIGTIIGTTHFERRRAGWKRNRDVTRRRMRKGEGA
jgi:hypothetical protein